MEIELVDIDGNPLPAGHGCSASVRILDSDGGSDWFWSWHYDWYELSATTDEAGSWEFYGFKWIQNRYGRENEHQTDRSTSYRIDGKTYYYPASGKDNSLRSGEEHVKPEHGGGDSYLYIYNVQAVFKKVSHTLIVWTLERPHLDAGTASPHYASYQGAKGDRVSITFSATPNEEDGWTFYRWKKSPDDPIDIIPKDKIKKRTFTIELEITQEYEQHFVYAIFNKRGILRDKRSNIILCNSTQTEILRMD